MDTTEIVAENGRRFAGFPAAVLVLIVDPGTRQFLLMSSPDKRRQPGWEVVNGAVEAGESLEQAALREVAEEAGPDVEVELFGVVNAWNWRYDALVTRMISVAYVASYCGGAIVPGDDMTGCEARWFGLDEIQEMAAAGTGLIPNEPVTFERALERFDALASRKHWEAESR